MCSLSRFKSAVMASVLVVRLADCENFWLSLNSGHFLVSGGTVAAFSSSEWFLCFDIIWSGYPLETRVEVCVEEAKE